MNKTKILAIEGIDGSGKTLQRDLLITALQAAGFTVAEKSFPEYDSFFGVQIGKMLKGDGIRADAVDSRSMCLWYAMDRWQSFAGYVDGQTDFLILNRFTASNAVYQSVREIDEGLEDNWEWVKALEHEQLGLPEPDLYLLLDVDPSTSQKNVDKKAKREYIDEGKRDVYEAQQGLLERARARYLSIAARESNFALIECMDDGALLPPEVIAARIWAALAERGFVTA